MVVDSPRPRRRMYRSSMTEKRRRIRNDRRRLVDGSSCAMAPKSWKGQS